MKLKSIKQSLLEMWKSPTRTLRRANAGSIFSTNSDQYDKANTIDPTEYFKKQKIDKN